jgi:hypothetical protein
MQRLLAIAFLTLKAAFRFRLVLVLAALLGVAVIALPLVIKHDGSARGFTQILLTYTLTAITALLGLATLWLACGTLARDVEECQIQLVAVKPVARWQIWLGKWLGIMMLNTLLLGVSAAAVFFIMQWRARKLPPEEQQVLRNEVFVARGSLREPKPDIAADVERIFQSRVKQISVSNFDRKLLRQQTEEQVKWDYQLVPPQNRRIWTIDLGVRKNWLRDVPLYLRVKFHTPETALNPDLARPGMTFGAYWVVGPPDSPKQVRREMSLAPETFHEFAIPPDLFDDNGVLTIEFRNYNDTALLFPLDDGLEVLYREGGFGLNFFRGVAIIFCWLALLAALGLTAASFLSFPVAAFMAAAILMIGLSSGTLSTVAKEGTVLGIDHDTGKAVNPILDAVGVPLFKGLLMIVSLVREFSPIDALSTGRSITWGQLGQAIAQICLLMGGLLSAVGIIVFTRRELATAQGQY